MYELALFAGAGGGILGGKLCGFDVIGAVEIEDYPRKVLLQRQQDGFLPKFPIWDDVCTFRQDNPETSEYIKLLQSVRDKLVITGGFPCQDISTAGKGAGIAQDTRSGLWFEFARIIREIRPARILVENSPALTSRGLGIVLGDLASMGYNARWGVLGACDVGAPHKRERIWIVANSQKLQCDGSHLDRKDGNSPTQKSGSCNCSANVADSLFNGSQRRGEKWESSRQAGLCSGTRSNKEQSVSKEVCHTSSTRFQNREQKPLGESGQIKESQRSNRWSTEPAVDRVANGVACRVDRLKAIGNGQVPDVVQLAWEMLNN